MSKGAHTSCIPVVFQQACFYYHTASAGPSFLAPTDPPPLSVCSTSLAIISSWKLEPYISGWKGELPYFDILQGLRITRRKQNKCDWFQINLFVMARGTWSCHRMSLGAPIHACHWRTYLPCFFRGETWHLSSAWEGLDLQLLELAVAKPGQKPK